MEDRKYSESNFPSGTWESVWISLIMKAVREWQDRNFFQSFRTTKILFSWLPDECKKEAEGKIKAIEKKCLDTGLKWSLQHAVKGPEFLFSMLLDLHSTIQSSLETHGWICKAVGASPQIKHKKEAWA